MAAGSIFLPSAVGQDQIKTTKKDDVCLAGQRSGHNVYVVKKDTKYSIFNSNFDLKCGDVYSQPSRYSVVIYTAAGKRESLMTTSTMTPAELSGYRSKCGVKLTTPGHR
jgi:hypothetical protein